MRLEDIKAPVGARKKGKRVGRGVGSGRGKTSGRGHKGQKAREGRGPRLGFEGGQTPILRRVPKRGFVNPGRKEFSIVNVSALNRFEDGSEVTPDLLKDMGMVKDLKDGLKILGDGEIKKALIVKAHAFSEAARRKIEEAGGKAIEI
jgi:large subunit ribosomal protein L15